ncbi:GUN4 domain-containing protein [Microcystis aeruginosa]|uniref:GUN4-like domain-containing protein n=1 Tax=Microcystis aeruginosa PCC 9443 TaxID=1160281 RepID=I4FYN8_MICAE|nr:GUN4 domain-containing protein [Microcystis aeruginosa]CCI00799.1 conserved hypothetical protein [Microcystis aeruginosa PCC 9443]
MYASLANTVPQFIQALLGFKQQSANDLAYKCLQRLKTANRRIAPSLEQAITDLQKAVENPLFTPLETYLKNGQWREADEETARLMLLIAKREDEGWLDEESINNFPCEELRTIDKLWVDNSGGKFGFSVQKKVWLDCGGVPGEYDYDVYKKFADEVGWHRGGLSLINIDELTFSLEGSQHAYLPKPTKTSLGMAARREAGETIFVSFLAQRLVTCNISQT